MRIFLIVVTCTIFAAACDDDVCAPDCETRQCGDDGCGGSCGDCDTGESCSTEGICEPGCTPDCSGRVCGDDGCGGSCGECDDTETCSSDGTCEEECTPDCGTRQCGDDGCRESCGDCEEDEMCSPDGMCELVCTPDCDDRQCGDDGCGHDCGECDDGSICDESDGVCSKRTIVTVPMRDGVELDTLIILPDSTPPYPTLLIRTPYVDIGAREGAEFVFGPFVSDGFALVNQSVRGTAESGGVLRPLVQEFDDGEDTVEWLVDQSWSDGNIGTLGGSYEGFTAMAAAVRSPHVKVVLPDGYLSHTFRSWPITHDGAPTWSLLWWLHLVETGEDLLADLPTLSIVTNTRPAATLDEAIFGVEVPLWRELAEHMESDNDFWLDWSFDDELEEFCTPVLLLEATTEYEDDMLDNYLTLMSSTCSEGERRNQRFVLGDHGHTGAIYNPFAETPSGELIRGYVDAFLRDSPEALEGAASVTAYIRGANQWVTAPGWPLHDDREVFFADMNTIRDDMVALNRAAPSSEGSLSWVFDPELHDACGPIYSQLAYFVSSQLRSPLKMLGRAELTLSVTVDTPDADLFAYLFEIADEGAEWNVVSVATLRLRFRESMSEPIPVVPGERLEILFEFVATGYQFEESSQVGLLISSSECGQLENPNTGGSMMTETSTQPVQVELLSGPDHPTQLTLPIIR